MKEKINISEQTEKGKKMTENGSLSLFLSEQDCLFNPGADKPGDLLYFN